MKELLLIIGAGGHGKVVADIALKLNQWQRIAFLDDDESIETCMGLEIIGKVSDAIMYIDKSDFFIAIGNNTIRQRMQEKLKANELSIVKLIHPNAIIGSDVEIAAGSVVMAGVIINSSSKVGKGCIINTASSLDHDNIIEDYVHISPGVHLGGTVKVGSRSWIGIGAVVSNNVSVCCDCLLGAGSIVVKSISESGTYVGVPVKRINR